MQQTSALHSVLDNYGSSGMIGTPKHPPRCRLLPILAVLGNLVLAVSAFGQGVPLCLSGQGPLQASQVRCSEIEFVSQWPKAFLGATIQEQYVIYDQRQPEARWISITDGKVELSDGLSMEDALILMNQVYSDELKRINADADKERKRFQLHLADDIDGLNRITHALKGQPVTPEPWHKRARRRI